jgi:hypothetical protein
MNLLAYAQTFAQDLKTGAVYQKPLNPQEQIFHRAIGFLLDKAIAGPAGLNLAGDILSELLMSKQELAELQKKVEEMQKPVEPAPEEMPSESLEANLMVA